MENFDAFDVIARTRGKVDMDHTPAKDYLFLLWGTLGAVFFGLEFILWQFFRAEWCLWLWIGIPLIGIPWMVSLLRKDHDRFHMRTRRSRLVLDYWIFAAASFGIGGCVFGLCGVYELFTLPLIGLLMGIGAFLTGEVLRYCPMIVCGLVGAAIGMGSFLLMGDRWIWQTLAVAGISVVSLVIPALLFNKRVKDGI